MGIWSLTPLSGRNALPAIGGFPSTAGTATDGTGAFFGPGFSPSTARLTTMSEDTASSPSSGTPEQSEGLGLPAAIALVMGTVIGTGIFTLPAALAQYGLAGLTGFMLATIGAVAVAVVFGALARLYPAPGGPYAYAREGFGDMAGFWNAFSYWCSAWPGNAGVAISWVFYVQALFGLDPDNRMQSILIGLVGLWIPVIVNLGGAKSLGRFQLVTTVLKFLPLVFLATVGLFFAFALGNWPAWNPAGGSTLFALSSALTVATFAYVGIEAAVIGAGRVRNPQRNVPRATVWGTLATALLYIFVTIAVFGIVPNETLRATGAPFTEAFDAIFGGTWSGKLVALFAVISGLGALNGWTLVCGEVPYAAAKDGLFPKVFASTNRHDMPAFSIVSSAVLASLAVVLALGTRGGVDAFTEIVMFSGVTVGVPYFFSVLVQLYYLFTEGRRLNPATFPREVIVAAVALVFTFWMIAGSGQFAVYISMLIFLLGFVMMAVLYIQTGRFGPKRKGKDAA